MSYEEKRLLTRKEGDVKVEADDMSTNQGIRRIASSTRSAERGLSRLEPLKGASSAHTLIPDV